MVQIVEAKHTHKINSSINKIFGSRPFSSFSKPFLKNWKHISCINIFALTFKLCATISASLVCVDNTPYSSWGAVCTSAAISCLPRPVVSPPTSTRAVTHISLSPSCFLPSLQSLLSHKSFITLFGQLTPALPPPVAKAWFLIKPSNWEVKSQFHAPYSW